MSTVNRPLAALVIVLACSALGGCTHESVGPSLEDSAQVIQTDQMAYRADVRRAVGEFTEYDFQVTVTYRNESSSNVHLSRCSDTETPMYGVEFVEDSDRGSAYDPAWSCDGDDFDLVIEPGKSRTDTLDLRGPNVREGRNRSPVGALEGQFRIVYPVLVCADCAGPSNIVHHESNTFTVTLDDGD